MATVLAPASVVADYFSPKQLLLQNWWSIEKLRWHKYIIAVGAIRTGKSLGLSIGYPAWVMDTFRGEKKNHIVAAQTKGALEQNVLPYLAYGLGLLGYQAAYNSSKGLLTAGDQTFRCLGAPHERSQDVLQGFTAASTFLDEAALLPKNFVDQAIGRCATEARSKHWMNCNPGAPTNFIKKEYVDADINALEIRFKMEDNPGLPESEILALKRKYPSGVFRKRYIDGLWALAEGLVYSTFDEDAHVIDMDKVIKQRLKDNPNRQPFRYYAVGCDYAGGDDALVFTLWGFDSLDHRKTSFYCLREYYFVPDPENGVKRKTHTEMADEMVKFLAGIRPRFIAVDPGGGGTAFITELKRRRLPAKAADKGPDSLLARIEFVSDLHTQNQIYYCNKRCPNLIREKLIYSWDEKKLKPTPIDADNHALDAEGYVFTTGFGANKRSATIVGASGASVG
jgi:PBSX family phage terminase large subunit